MLKRLSGALLSLSLLTACSDAPGPQQMLETTVRGANAAALSQNANFALVAAVDHGGSLWDMRSDERLFDWNHQHGGVLKRMYHPASVRSVAINDEGSLALTGADDYVARIWDVANEEVLFERTFTNIIDSVALAPNNRLAFTAETLGSAQIWDITTGETVHSLSGDEWYWPKRVSYLSAHFSDDSTLLLTGTASGLVQLWDTGSDKELDRWRVATKEKYGPVQTGVYDVVFGPDNSISAMGSNGLWNRFNR